MLVNYFRDKGTNKRAKYKINKHLFLFSSESTFGEAKGR